MIRRTCAMPFILLAMLVLIIGGVLSAIANQIHGGGRG